MTKKRQSYENHFTSYWQRHFKQQHIFSHAVSIYTILAVLCAGRDQIMRCRLSPTPWGSQRAMLSAHGWIPIIHRRVGDRLVNPQFHCSQTTVEIEVSKCLALVALGLISPGRTSRPGDTVSGLQKTCRDCGSIHSSPSFNYPQIQF